MKRQDLDTLPPDSGLTQEDIEQLKNRWIELDSRESVERERHRLQMESLASRKMEIESKLKILPNLGQVTLLDRAFAIYKNTGLQINGTLFE